MRQFNLLSLHGQERSPNDDGDYCFNGDVGGMLIAAAPETGSSFNLQIEVSVEPQLSGYIYAKTESSGFRFAGLYVRSRNRGLIFYYKAVGSDEQKSVQFEFSTLGDGAPHRVELAVHNLEASLFVDGGAIGTQLLDGFVDDCGVPGPECITHIGQRQLGYPLTGCVSSATLEKQTPEAFDLLQPEYHDNAVAAVGDNVYCFEGNSPGLQLTHFPVSSSTFSVSVNFRVSKGVFGYLLSKGAGGKNRYFSLYIQRSDQRVVMYYQASGSSKQHKLILTEASVVGDNTLHVSVQGSSVQTELVNGDGVTDRSDLALAGPVGDCDAPATDCTFHVGQRVGGLELNSGCILNAELYPGMP